MGSIGNLRRLVVEKLLETEDYFLIVVDPTGEGVLLPQQLLDTKQPVGINIGYRMAVPISDLSLDDAAICGTLSFSRSPFYCTFPWSSIVQVSVGDEHLLWAVPRVSVNDGEGDETGDGGDGQGDDVASEESPPKARPALRLV